MYDITIIGGGIIGCTIGRELSRYPWKTLLVEKAGDLADGSTKANSAIVHAGFDAEPGSLKARFNVAGNLLYDQLCTELSVPFKRIGSLVLAFSEAELPALRALKARGERNGVPGLELDTRVMREGSRAVLSDNTMMLPAWTRWDAGMTWRTKSSVGDLMFRVAVDNLADKRYWRESPQQFGHYYLYPGAPRTLRFSVQADL